MVDTVSSLFCRSIAVDETHLLVKTDMLDEIKAEFQAQVCHHVASVLLGQRKRNTSAESFSTARGIYLQGTGRSGIGQCKAETAIGFATSKEYTDRMIENNLLGPFAIDLYEGCGERIFESLSGNRVGRRIRRNEASR